jgi:hypothetical protein
MVLFQLLSSERTRKRASQRSRSDEILGNLPAKRSADGHENWTAEDCNNAAFNLAVLGAGFVQTKTMTRNKKAN